MKFRSPKQQVMSLRGGGSVLRSKGHLVGLEQSHGGAESHFVFVLLCHLHLPITSRRKEWPSNRAV